MRSIRALNPPARAGRYSQGIEAPAWLFLDIADMTHSPLPVLFVSHGSPMFALDPGQTGPALQRMGARLRERGDLRAVLVLSPHWMSRGIEVMTNPQPATWHDFGGFPEPLYRLQYPAPGAPELEPLTTEVWGGDHVNKVTTPSLAAEIGAQVERVVARNAVGTFHLVGDDAVDRMQLARLTCDIFELDSGLLRETEPPVEELFPGPVPVDSSLANSRTKEILGIAPQPISQILMAFKSELVTGEIQALTKPE